MPNVLNEFAGDGVTRTFTFSMTGGYLSRDYVYFYTRPNEGLLSYTPYDDANVTWVGDYTVQLSAPIPIGTTFVILRSTPLSSLVNFQNTSRITEKNLDTATQQAIHIASESSDLVGRLEVVVKATKEDVEASLLGAEEASEDASQAAQAALSAASAAGQAQSQAQQANSAAQAAVQVAHEVKAIVVDAVSGSVVSFNGRVGGVTPQAGDYTKTMVGLGNVDNTADSDKPLSTAQQTAFDSKVDKVAGKGLSSNDFTDAERVRLANITDDLATKADKTTQVIAGTGLSGGGTLDANRTLNVSYGTTAGTAAQGDDARITGAFQKSQVVQITGTSTTEVISQKAVTDALGQPSMAGSATLNGTIDNKVVLTDIVTTLGLEVGDVIRIQYSGYNKLHSVESVPNNNTIIVNYAHAGNRGKGSLQLANTTASVTVTRIAKWYNAPLGLGQAWLDINSSRSAGVTYTNNTGRPISVSVVIAVSGNSIAFLQVDGAALFAAGTTGTGGGFREGLTGIVPNGSTYSIVLGAGAHTIMTYSELR